MIAITGVIGTTSVSSRLSLAGSAAAQRQLHRLTKSLNVIRRKDRRQLSGLIPVAHTSL
jgi:hypothetical protein